MKREKIALALLLLAGCSGGEEGASQEQAPVARPAVQAPPEEVRETAPPAKPRNVHEKEDLLEFTYGWPSEAAAIPSLNSRLEADLRAQRQDAVAAAKEDKEARGADIPFNGHYFSKVWKTLGSSGKLLSLAAEVGTFTGGAHGNAAYQAILWNRDEGSEIKLGALFQNPAAAYAAMTPGYCKELDRQRAEKRQGMDPSGTDDWTTQCPALSEQVMLPVDANRDGKFDLFRVLLEPYNAGPYAEGSYEIDLPVTDAIRRLVKPDYSASF